MQGIERALEREKGNRVYDKKVDRDLEAKIISIACSKPPQGYAKWSLRMIAGKAVELHYVDELSHVSVYSVLKKNELKPWKIAEWVIPPEQNAEFVDNHPTHTIGSFYEVFEPSEAKRLIDRFEFVFTPKHGSWLNMAEIELHILNRQCLNRHIASIEEMHSEALAWQTV